MKAAGPPPARNEVVLVGRVAAPPEERALPSGDLLVSLRLVVDRPLGRSVRARRPRVDTLDCAAWTAGLRRTVRGFAVGDVVVVQGALRRHFRRTPAGPVSRSEVEMISARRLWRPPP